MRKLDNLHILVTGGCGFMGSDFIRYSLAHFPELKVTNIDALTYAADQSNLDDIDSKRYTFIKGDIADEKLVSELVAGVDMIVNFAAETHVDRSIHGDTRDFIHTNIFGVHSLLRAAVGSSRLQLFLHVSTDEVWGDLPLESRERFTEESPFRPNSPYAASKAAGDLLIRAYVQTYNLPAVVTHSVNNFGERQFREKLIPFFTLRALADQPLPLYGTGENMRDWLYVEDHSAAICTLLEHGVAGEVYNISQQREYSNLQIAERILDMLGKPRSLITHIADRPGHDLKYAVDSSKLRALGWTPRFSLEEKLSEVVRTIAARGGDASNVNPHIRI
jgi:dTDP-glucose 4,6-dehydratase